MSNESHIEGRRRFGWYRAKPHATFDPTIFDPPLDATAWEQFRHYTRVVEYLRPYMVDYLALCADFEAVSRAEKEIGEALSEKTAIDTIAVSAGVEANASAQRRVSNFLGAASAFRDRAATRIAEEFGRKSAEAAAFKNEASRWFDASFAYRCMYQLRNFAQHHELPISLVPINADRARDNTMVVQIRLLLSPARLASSERVSAKVRTELKMLPSEPLDLSDLLRDYMRAQHGLMATSLGFYTQRMGEMAHYQAWLYTTFEIPHDVTPVIWEGGDPAAGLGAQERAIMMGFDELHRAFNLREQLSRAAST